MRIILLFMIAFMACKVSAQYSIQVYAPGLHQQIDANQKALISWRLVKKNPDAEFTVSIRTLFDDELFTVVSKDTFLVLTPEIGKDENNLLIRIYYGKLESDYHTLKRNLGVHDINADSVRNLNECKNLILAQLDRRCYLSALYTYEANKSKFDLSEYTVFFNEVNQVIRKNGNIDYFIKDGHVLYKVSQRKGAVHREQ